MFFAYPPSFGNERPSLLAIVRALFDGDAGRSHALAAAHRTEFAAQWASKRFLCHGCPSCSVQLRVRDAFDSVSPMRLFALDASEAAKREMFGWSAVHRSCLLARELHCVASARFFRRFFAFSVLPCAGAFVRTENWGKARCMALRARGPLTLLRGILGKEPSHGNCTLRDGGASKMNDPTALPVVFARVRNSAGGLPPIVLPTVSPIASRMPNFDAFRRKGFSLRAPARGPSAAQTSGSFLRHLILLSPSRVHF
ncbi:hypothetical protein TRVL_06288 [Trypanosoma vivax]|nr:hypothetical protein TRVL_06288 [Trypanosoma vivax]